MTGVEDVRIPALILLIGASAGLTINYLILEHPPLVDLPALWFTLTALIAWFIVAFAGLALRERFDSSNSLLLLYWIATMSPLLAWTVLAVRGLRFLGSLGLLFLALLVVLQAVPMMMPRYLPRALEAFDTTPYRLLLGCMILLFSLGIAGNRFVVEQDLGRQQGAATFLSSAACFSEETAASDDSNDCAAATLRSTGLLPAWAALSAFPFGKPTETLAWEQPAFYDSAIVGWTLLMIRLSLILTLFEALKDLVKQLRKTP